MQNYHSNAATNLHIRGELRNSAEKNFVLATKFSVSKNTVSKWKNREALEDRSSRPHTIHYALSPEQVALAVLIRQMTWLPVAEVYETILQTDKTISQSAVYRTLVRYGINKIPQEKREKAKEFKEYDPGFVHVDVTYLPTFGGQKYYLFVAIDRATRLLFYEVFEEKSARNAATFLQHCKDFFPFKINKILTDNGLEFTNRLLKSKKGELCKKDSLFDLECKKDEENPIEHRLTAPHTPKTNGMVERVNGTIKSSTILVVKYLTKQEMENDLIKFLVFYNLNRRHGSLRKELNVRTPYNALEKWYNLKPKLFLKKPDDFKKNLITLQCKITHIKQQRGET